ncbi:MAG: CHAD domain-containing protein [Rhodothermales bacterium]
MRASAKRYIIVGKSSTGSELGKILRGFDLEFEPVTRHVARFYDTFDWRLYEADREMFVESGGQHSTLFIREQGRRQELFQTRLVRPPRFASDLPKGPARDGLTSITGLRALLPIVRVSYRQRLVRVLNVDKKTVVRLWVLSAARATNEDDASTHRLPEVIEVAAVLGYDNDASDISAALADAGLKEVGDNLLELSLAAIGREPLDYSSRPRIILDRGMSMDEALRTILINLTRTVRANENGILEDLDIEFLHDFRVATRRTRSVISQFKKGISSKVLKTFRPGFKWLGKVTGPTRDADVYLENVDGYRAVLPDEVGEQLLPLRDFLERKRAREFKIMARSMKTKRYQQLLANWESLLFGTDVHGAAPLHKGASVVPAVSARIWKVYGTIIKQGSAITPTTPATALHNLRLVSKNLRYLLEIFRSLYPADAIDLLISELKVLQNNLGDVQDLEVQRHALDAFAQEMLEEGPVASGTVMAMGRLAASLEERQHKARAEFAGRFARFARKKNRRTFRKLFKDQR